ncbi:heterokaryon incompatibility protein-domain-containing protein [Lenzites betulinus]|nr:heterokaryon incompatibility protein-domain-containing protein [Lenzites betulinus]
MPVDAAVLRYPSESSLSSEKHHKGPDAVSDPFDSYTTTVSPTLVDPWQTLAQLPFFPYDCRLAGYTLPPKPDTLCASCWEGPFGAHAAWLCDVADEIQDASSPSALKSYSYRTSKGDLESRARMGCAWCSAVKLQVLAIWQESVNIVIELGLAFDNGVPPTGMHMMDLSSDGNRRGYRYAYKLDDDHPAAAQTRLHAPILDVGSARAFQSARELMQNCEKNHARCRAISIPAEQTTLPKRLIDCTDPERPRLVESSKGECGQYVALSYVWGGEQPHKTTQTNLSTYECRIKLALLPQTIRDAIRVTRELGFKLLWVDSLCIVQDSGEKQHEIGHMHHIFRYAVLTIVAASAHDATDGFLHDRQPWMPDTGFIFDPFSLPILYPQAHATAAPQMGTLTLCPDFALPSYRDREMEPINQRAWCLQEEIMSPRSLIFSSHTLRFRCQTATHSIGNSFYQWEDEVRLPDALLLHTPSPLEHGTPDWHDVKHRWIDVVEEYTGRSMTESSDKLVPCPAIAQAFYRVLTSDYLAGLWRYSLFTDLLWRVSAARSRPAAFRAPSWSWAAVDGKVSRFLFIPGFHKLAEVIRCDVLLKEDSLPFGEVSGGSLVLRGQMLQLQLMNRDARQVQFNPTEHLLRDRRLDLKEDAAADSVLWYNMKWDVAYDFDSADDYDDPSWAIPFVCPNHLNHWIDMHCHGLIVAQANPATSDPILAGGRTLYRRIGWFGDLRRENVNEFERLLFQPLKNKEVPLQEIEII